MNPRRSPVLHESIDGRHVIALIDDHRPSGAVVIEQNPPENSSVAVEANRRGDRRSSYRLRCAGCATQPAPMRGSTVVAALDLWVTRVAPHMNERVIFHDEDVPATDDDAQLLTHRFEADLFGQSCVGPEPQFVPRMVDRRVISWSAFNACVSNLSKDR